MLSDERHTKSFTIAQAQACSRMLSLKGVRLRVYIMGQISYDYKSTSTYVGGSCWRTRPAVRVHLKKLDQAPCNMNTYHRL